MKIQGMEEVEFRKIVEVSFGLLDWGWDIEELVGDGILGVEQFRVGDHLFVGVIDVFGVEGKEERDSRMDFEGLTYFVV
jgi:hypothetical protein